MFDLGPRQRSGCVTLMAGSDSVRVIVGDALEELHRGLGLAGYDTIAVHELHTLGPTGCRPST